MTANTRPSATVTVVEQPGLVPRCPYCDETLATVNTAMLATSGSAPFRFGKRYGYACPACNRLLAISHRKGFWMG